jgi:hypothetical protein
VKFNLRTKEEIFGVISVYAHACAPVDIIPSVPFPLALSDTIFCVVGSVLLTV